MRACESALIRLAWSKPTCLPVKPGGGRLSEPLLVCSGLLAELVDYFHPLKKKRTPCEIWNNWQRGLVGKLLLFFFFWFSGWLAVFIPLCQWLVCPHWPGARGFGQWGVTERKPMIKWESLSSAFHTPPLMLGLFHFGFGEGLRSVVQDLLSSNQDEP